METVAPTTNYGTIRTGTQRGDCDAEGMAEKGIGKRTQLESYTFTPIPISLAFHFALILFGIKTPGPTSLVKEF